MTPDAETIWMVNAFEHQERMRNAAQQRIAASAHMGARSRRLQPRPVVLAAAAWLGAFATRVHGTIRVSRPLTTG